MPYVQLSILLEDEMRLKLTMFTLIAAAFLSSGFEASAMRACAPYDTIKKSLVGKYKESRKAYGLSGGKQLLEVFVSERGTWTVVVTNLQGLACVLPLAMLGKTCQRW